MTSMQNKISTQSSKDLERHSVDKNYNLGKI